MRGPGARLAERTRESRPRFHAHLDYEQLPWAAWVRDASGKVIFANSAAASLFGLSHPSAHFSDAVARDFRVCDDEGEILARDEFPSRAAYRTGQRQQRCVGIIVEGRPTRWLLMDCLPVMDEAGRLLEVVSMAVEVTSLRHAEVALRSSEERFRRVIEATHEGLCLVDLDSTIVFVNSRLCDMLGYNREELLSKHSLEVLGKAVQTFHERRGASRRDVPLRRRDGGTAWATVNATPLLGEGGKAAGMLVMFADVTARKQSQERAKAAAEKIEQLTADAIYTIDRLGVLQSWNNGAEGLFGWSREEVVGRKIALVPKDHVARAKADLGHVIETGATVTKETVCLSKDGQRIDVLGSWSPVALDDGRTGVLCILKDIRARKAVEEQLYEQTRSLTLLRERERIAMDLHDGVIQSLYGVALSLGALRRRSDPGGDGAVLDYAIGQLTESIQGIRHYIYQLRTGESDDADLEVELRAKAEDVARQAGVTPHVSIQTDLRYLNSESAHHLLYIAQEALSNVARHAHATDVAIHIVPWGAGTMLTVVDNGRGFDPARKGRRLGDGLRNMRERATQLGATLTVDSQPGTGTTVKVLLP